MRFLSVLLLEKSNLELSGLESEIESGYRRVLDQVRPYLSTQKAKAATSAGPVAECSPYSV